MQRRRWEAKAKARQVALEEGPNELPAPFRRRRDRRRGERARKAATQPESVHGRFTDLVEAEATETVEADSAGQRLGALLEEVEGGAAQHEEPHRRSRPVGEDPQHGKQVRAPVQLVDDDEAGEVREGERRVGELREVSGILEIEDRGWPSRRAALRDELASERGLSDLAGAEQRDDGKMAEQAFDGLEVSGARDVRHTLKSRSLSSNFQGSQPRRAPGLTLRRSESPEAPPHGRSACPTFALAFDRNTLGEVHLEETLVWHIAFVGEDLQFLQQACRQPQ